MRKLAGIEINNDLISFVLLTEESNSCTIEKAENFSLKDISLEDFITKIKDHLSYDDQVSLSVPLELFSVRNIKVPFRSKDKIEKIIDLELEEHIPFEISNLKTAFKLTQNSSVITFSINNEILNSYLSVFKDKGINVDLITITGLPLSELINQKIPDQSKLVIQYRNDKISLYLYEKSTVAYVKSVYGKVIKDNLKDKLGLETRLFLNDYFLKFGNEFKAERIFIDSLEENKERISETLFNLFGITPENADLIKNYDSRFSSAAALALYSSKIKENINFTKKRNPLLLFFSEYKSYLKKSAVFAGIILLFMIFNAAGSYMNLKNISETYDLKMIEVFKRSFPEIKKIRNPYPHMISKVKELSKSNPMINSGVRKIDILNEINRNLPESVDVTFTKISIGSEVVSISGQTESFILVDTIRNKLEKISYFESVSMSSPTKSGRENRVNFRLNIKLKRF